MRQQKWKEKFLQNKLYKLIIYFYLFNFIISTCDKSTPFLQNDECISYCSYLNLIRGVCILNNSIIESQLLTNIISIGGINFKYLSYAFNLDGDMVILASENPPSNSRIFYGLKKNGRNFFNNSLFYLKYINDESYYNQKYESETLFVRLSSNDEDINGKEYFLSVPKYCDYVELFDFDNNEYYALSITIFYEDIIQSYFNSFLKLSDESNKYYYIFAGISTTYYFNIKKFSFSSKIIYDGYTLHNYNNSTKSLLRRIASCFQTEKLLIICFVEKDDYNYVAIIYDENLTQLSENIILSGDFTKENEDIFYKCIHFKGEIGIFSYYLSYSNVSPIISFKQANTSTQLIDYNNYGNIILNKVESENYSGLNDIMKLDENTICYASVGSNREILNIILIKIYGDNDSKLSLRYYSINTYMLHSYKFYTLKIFSYNNFVSMLSSYCLDTNHCKTDNDPHYASLIIFSYGNSFDSYFNIYDFLSQSYANLYDLCFTLQNNIKIDNNIFGLQFYGIKIMNFPDNIV